jgi:hypothetical protein
LIRDLKREYRLQDRERAFLQMRLGLKPVTGPLGHSLDMIDGGPDGADIAPQAPFGKQQMPHFAGF